VSSRPAPTARLRSLDALRGFDMLWIAGLGAMLGAWADSNDWGWLDAAQAQTEHVEWHGFTFWDLIFPLFLFVAGVSLALSFGHRRAEGARDSTLALHALRRGLTLVALGLVYNGLLKFDLGTLRCASVLGRIGLAWMGAAWIALAAPSFRARLAWAVGLLLGYWALLTLVPVPGFGPANLEPGTNLVDWFDQHFLPGRLYRTVRDPEGLLATLPAIATALGGVLAGDWLARADVAPARKVTGLAGAAFACLAAGALWALVFPLNKNLWTSSFVLWCAGWSLVLLAGFHLALDVLRLGERPVFGAGVRFLEVIGANAITIYVLQSFLDFDALARLLLEARGALKLHPALVAGGGLGLKWLVLWLLWRARLFLRV
jgi:predicted acyltransferase